MRRCARTIFLVSLCILFLSSACSANPSLPIIFTSTPLMLAGLIVVVLIETWMFRIGLKRPYHKIGLAVGSANTVSAAVGYPLSLAAQGAVLFMPSRFLVAIQRGTLEDFWLWLLLWGTGLILTFFVSVHLEYFIIRVFFRNGDKRKMKRLSYGANLVTHALLLAVLLTLTFPM